MRIRQVGVVGVLLMGLCLVEQVAMAHTGGDALSPPRVKQSPASHPVAVQMLSMPLQFEANHGQVDDQVKFLSRGKGYTLFLTPTESVMMLSQQDIHVPIDDRCEEFIMALTFAPSQQNANTEVGHRTVTDPLMNTEPPPIKHSVLQTKLEEARVASGVGSCIVHGESR